MLASFGAEKPPNLAKNTIFRTKLSFFKENIDLKKTQMLRRVSEFGSQKTPYFGQKYDFSN